MKALCIIQNEEKVPVEMTRRDFIARYTSLHMRDLRPIFSPLQVSTILPRREVVIINLGFIKAVLSSTEIYFLVYNNESQIFEVCDRISTRPDDGAQHHFAVHALEKILESKLIQMRRDMSEIEESTERTLSQIRKNFSEHYLEDLLVKKKRISKDSSRIEEVGSAIEEVLDDNDGIDDLIRVILSLDTDIEEIALTDDYKQLATELTSVFESFIEQVEDIERRTRQLSEDVEDTEEFLTLRLNARRTATIRADLMATIMTLILSFLAVVVGLYGTNILNGFENNPQAFEFLAIFLVVFFIVAGGLAFYTLKKKRLF